MADITYNFGENYGTFGDLNSHFGDLATVGEDIQTIRTAVSQVYEGDGATAMLARIDNISAMLDEAITLANNTTKNANEQNTTMEHLDKQNASAF